MRLSRRADYAMRMMVDLACMSNDQRTTVGEITQRQDVAEPFMAKIASQAAVAGLVVTQRGTGGGLVLAQPADSTTMLQIIEAIDGPLAFNRCTCEPSQCPRFNKCAVHPIWEKAQQQLKDLLVSTVLSEIALEQSVIGV